MRESALCDLRGSAGVSDAAPASAVNGGGCAGSISYPLPSGYNRGLIQIGVSYTNPSCHGTVTVGDQTLFDDNGGIGNDVMKLEFMYNEVPRSTRKHATNRPLTPSLYRAT